MDHITIKISLVALLSSLTACSALLSFMFRPYRGSYTSSEGFPPGVAIFFGVLTAAVAYFY